MIEPTVSRLVERNAAASTVLARVAKSLCCDVDLQGSASMWCGRCGRTVPAADIDHEYHTPGGAS
jgi:hypothetical protein